MLADGQFSLIIHRKLLVSHKPTYGKVALYSAFQWLHNTHHKISYTNSHYQASDNHRFTDHRRSPFHLHDFIYLRYPYCQRKSIYQENPQRKCPQCNDNNKSKPVFHQGKSQSSRFVYNGIWQKQILEFLLWKKLRRRRLTLVQPVSCQVKHVPIIKKQKRELKVDLHPFHPL